MYNNQKQKHNGTCECEISISELANVIGNKNERTLKEKFLIISFKAYY